MLQRGLERETTVQGIRVAGVPVNKTRPGGVWSGTAVQGEEQIRS